MSATVMLLATGCTSGITGAGVASCDAATGDVFTGVVSGCGAASAAEIALATGWLVSTCGTLAAGTGGVGGSQDGAGGRLPIPPSGAVVWPLLWVVAGVAADSSALVCTSGRTPSESSSPVVKRRVNNFFNGRFMRLHSYRRILWPRFYFLHGVRARCQRKDRTHNGQYRTVSEAACLADIHHQSRRQHVTAQPGPIHAVYPAGDFRTAGAGGLCQR